MIFTVYCVETIFPRGRKAGERNTIGNPELRKNINSNNNNNNNGNSNDNHNENIEKKKKKKNNNNYNNNNKQLLIAPSTLKIVFPLRKKILDMALLPFWPKSRMTINMKN